MTAIAYYISDYGYGHAARSIAVIRLLLDRFKSVRVIICTAFPMDFVKQSLAAYPQVQYRYVVNDIGYFLIENSLEPDIERLKREFDCYIESAHDQMAIEIAFLLHEKVDFVISDIAPIPFLCADQLGITSIGISNFTWYTAYQSWLPESKLTLLKQAYSKIDHFIALAGANEPLWGRHSNQTVDFISREVIPEEVERIRSRMKPNPSKALIYVGFGMKVNVDVLSSWQIWNNDDASFIVSKSLAFKHPNVSVIPHQYMESQHYIAASDLVITKAGWGTVSEAVISGKPLLILNRSGMQEDTNTIRYLQDKNLCSLIEWDDISNLSIKPNTFLEQHKRAQESISNLNHKEEMIHSIIGIIKKDHGRRKEII